MRRHGQSLVTIPAGFVLGRVRPVRDQVSATSVEGIMGETLEGQVALEQSRQGWRVCDVISEGVEEPRVAVMDGFGVVRTEERLGLSSCVLVNEVMQYVIPRNEHLKGDERERRWMDRRSRIPYVPLSGGEGSSREFRKKAINEERLKKSGKWYTSEFPLEKPEEADYEGRVFSIRSKVTGEEWTQTNPEVQEKCEEMGIMEWPVDEVKDEEVEKLIDELIESAEVENESQRKTLSETIKSHSKMFMRKGDPNVIKK